MAQPRTSVSLTTTRVRGNKPQRQNNPGNLKYSPVVDQWVQRGPNGEPLADEQGHLLFATPEDGWKALEADIAAKQQGRSSWMPKGGTLATLGGGVDGQGGYAEDPNWATGVSKILGLPIDTPIDQIPLDDLTKAIARQEGFFADSGGEFETKSGTSLFPKTEGRIEAVRPPDMPGIGTSDEDVSTVEEALAKQRIKDEFGGASLPLDYGQTKIDVDPWTDVTTRGHLFPRGPESLTPSEAISRAKAGEPLGRFSQKPFDWRKASKLLSRVGQTESREIDDPGTIGYLQRMGGTTDLTTAEAQRRAGAIERKPVTRPTQPPDAFARQDQEALGVGGELPGFGFDSQLDEVDLEGMAPESPSFLSRLGSGIKDNPEVALQIASLLGGVGSGLMGRGRLAKQQAEQDAANRQAAAYANAISTLTRGRTTPAMAPRQVRSTPGTAETIMDVLGTLGQGGAKIAAAHRQRGQAEEDRQRAQAMEDFKMQHMTRGQDFTLRGQDMDLMGQMIAAQGAGDGEGNDIDVLDQVIDVAEGLFNEAPTGPIVGRFGKRPESQYFDAGKAASKYDGYRNLIKGQIAKLIGGSRPSDLDMQLADEIVPTRQDLSAPDKFNLLRQLNQFRRGKGMEGNIGHMIDPSGLTFAAGQTDMSMNLQALSDAQLYQYAQQNRNDPAVEAELNRRLGN